ncbi:hypothetical protein WS67_21160 [Burkholderia singularis]|uniref:Uncharacterized protein n=1 Tax=Burkholderia singularis TaxID=1503053 RepID=A0A103DY82_9BURK|nr:hypothetical protein WS67_21160 [Burkholderia singularis]
MPALSASAGIAAAVGLSIVSIYKKSVNRTPAGRVLRIISIGGADNHRIASKNDVTHAVD